MKAKKRPRANEVLKELRVQAILQIMLDGAEKWDIVQFVAEKEQADEAPWKMGRGKKQLALRTVESYITAANLLIQEAFAQANKGGIAHHILKRRNLYARAVQAGDYRTALAVLADIAALEDAYPAKRMKAEHTGHVAITDDLSDLTPAELDAERRRLETLLANPSPASGGKGP